MAAVAEDGRSGPIGGSSDWVTEAGRNLREIPRILVMRMPASFRFRSSLQDLF